MLFLENFYKTRSLLGKIVQQKNTTALVIPGIITPDGGNTFPFLSY